VPDCTTFQIFTQLIILCTSELKHPVAWQVMTDVSDETFHRPPHVWNVTCTSTYTNIASGKNFVATWN